MIKLIQTLALSLCVVSVATASVTELYTTSDVQTVFNASLPVIVDIYSSSCNPCQRLMPIFTQVSDDYTGTVQFVKVNTNSAAFGSFSGINSVPTLLFYYKGALIGKTTGFKTAAKLQQQITTWLASITQ